MNTKKYLKYSILPLALMLGGLAFTACTDDIEGGKPVDEGAYDAVKRVDGMLLDVTSNKNESVIELRSDKHQTEVFFRLTKAPQKGVDVKIEMDPAYLETYNAEHGTEFELFPAANVAIDREGGEVSFAIAEQPSKGTVTLDGETFVYTSAKNKTGADRFTYTATDAAGSTSAPAEVRITIVRAKCGVTYDDMVESAAYTAAVDLAEHGVFVGAQVGSRRFFEPDRAVSRGEFVTMALACAGIPAGDLMMTGFCDDAEIPTWAKGSAVSALQCGLIRGVGTEGGMAFCADEGVTLSEAATVLNRLLRVTDVDLSDYDAGSADAWSAQAVANLESVRVIESGSFSAGDWQRPLTRGEAAQLLSAAMTLAEKKQESAGLLSGLFK